MHNFCCSPFSSGLPICFVCQRPQRSPCGLQDSEQPHLDRPSNDCDGSDGRNRVLRSKKNLLLDIFMTEIATTMERHHTRRKNVAVSN